MSKPTLHSDNTKPKNFLESLQAMVINRYTNPYGKEPIVYEFTQDRGLIHQYHLLLERMYKKLYNVKNFNAGDDVYDKLSYVLIARRGRLCLGGCRLTVREHDEMWKLPLEDDNFKLRELFPLLPLNSVRHGEMSRFVVMDDCGDKDILYTMCKMMYEKVIDLNVSYLFARSYYNLARNWRLIANSLGVRTTEICQGIEVPDYPGVPDKKMFITLSNLTSYNKNSEFTNTDNSEDIHTSSPNSFLSLVE